LVRELTELGKDDVFHVDTMDSFSFFNTDKKHSEKVLEAIQGIEFNGRKVDIEISKDKGRKGGGRRGSGGRDRGGRRKGDRKFEGGRRSGKSEGKSEKGKRRSDSGDGGKFKGKSRRRSGGSAPNKGTGGRRRRR
ncbi:MAG: DbpA RNA binding domain-containing protein, partial [Bacteroidota bacterium]